MEEMEQELHQIHNTLEEQIAAMTKEEWGEFILRASQLFDLQSG